ncbi:GntR family transcriptional regulator [Paeniglutamicibacter cryotolerans]|uniref:DNA-binding transcriptional regulator YhcF (GntR family) n=1 Tax=Paeniglutamicibacter cryotolerans TaxID=670079 RepID=A0A839QIS0_9MICC|nr:GntR family transcriptional regulator [Paeniglutamicibacter cryotolerans]MBB2996089.1 DNA-binding transcriptional regulator YhcF (GntR family) [Paeniglutamicibacter cryotolerans]
MIVLDESDAHGPAEQIRAQIAALIRAGELAAESRLPPVRQLAGDLRVAPGTVAKAYKELEAAGMVRAGRAAGTRVNPGQVIAAPALTEAVAFGRAARDAGLSLAEAQSLLAAGWNA